MSLLNEAGIAFTAGGIAYSEDLKDGIPVFPGTTARVVRVMLAECASDLYGLLVYATVDGENCANPPVRLWRIFIPDARIKYSATEAHGHGTITVTHPNVWRFTLRFQNEDDFWEVLRIMSEVKGPSAARLRQADELLAAAADTLPLVPVLKEAASVGVQAGAAKTSV